MNQMELERQHLLSMLWDAGLCDFHLLDEDPTDNLSVIESSTVPVHSRSSESSIRSATSVIDLVGDDSESHISNEPKHPIDTAYREQWNPKPFCSSSAAHVCGVEDASLENIGDVANIDPHELSFEIQGQNHIAPSQPAALARRVFKPEEWKLIDWSALENEKLKTCMVHFGLKPSGGKASMVANLQRIFQFLDEDTSKECVPELTAGDDSLSREEMFEEFSRLIQGNAELYEKIILFESVELGSVHRFLETKRHKERWRSFSLNMVRDYLENAGVQYNNTTSHAGPTEEANRRKKRRHLRKSISCP